MISRGRELCAPRADFVTGACRSGSFLLPLRVDILLDFHRDIAADRIDSETQAEDLVFEIVPGPTSDDEAALLGVSHREAGTETSAS